MRYVSVFTRFFSESVCLFVCLLVWSALVSAQSATITSLSPNQTTVGQAPAKIVLKGTGLVANSQVFFDDTQVTAKVKSSQTKIVLKNPPATLFSTNKILAVRVVTPDGQASAAVEFAVGSTNTIQITEPQNRNVNAGDSLTLRATVLDRNGQAVTGAPISFRSLNPERLTVDATGLLRGVSGGAATVRLTSGEATLDETFTVSEVAAAASGIIGDGDVKIDANNRVYASDLRNHVVKSAPIGQPLQDYAGLSGTPGNIDGLLTQSRFNGPFGIGIGTQFVFLADTANRSIRRFNPNTGTVETIIHQTDVAAQAGISNWGPRGVVQLGDGTLFITDGENHVVWKANLNDGVKLSVLAGSLGLAGKVDGVGGDVRFNNPQDLAPAVVANQLVVSDRGNKVIRLVDVASGQVTTIGVLGNNGLAGRQIIPHDDQTGSDVTFEDPAGVAVDPVGNVYVSDGSSVKVLSLTDSTVSVADLCQRGTFTKAVGIAIGDGSAYVLDSGKQQLIRVGLGTAPTITSLSPTQVRTGESPIITVLGTNFLRDTQVRIGSVPAQEVRVESSTRLSFKAPPLTQPGTVEVRLQHRAGAATANLTVIQGGYFTLNLKDREQTVTAGQGTMYGIQIARTGYDGPVSLQVAGVPSGVQAKFTPNPVTGQDATLQILTATNTPSGRYALKITGNFSAGQTPGLSNSVEAVLNVIRPEPAVVALSLTPQNQNILPGQAALYTIGLKRSNFSGDVRLAVSGLPQGMRALIDPETVQGDSARLTITSSPTNPSGTIQFTVMGQANGASVQSVTGSLSLSQPQGGTVRLSANPPAQTITAGQTATYAVTLFRGDFTGEVRLSLAGVPPGLEAEISPDSTTGTSATLTVRTNSTAAGSANITINGQANGANVTPVTVNLTVTAPSGTASVKVSAAPPAATINAGQDALFSLSLTRSNFTGEVRFAATGFPTGVIAEFNPPSTTGNTSGLTLRSATSAPPGTYTISIGGQATGATVSPVTVNLVIGSGNAGGSVRITATPASQTVQAGQSTTYQVTLTRTNFTDSVRFGVSGLPSGATATFNPDDTKGNTATLTVTTGAATPGGTYTLSIGGLATGITIASVPVTLVVSGGATSGSVALGATPTSQTVTAGSSTTYQISLTRSNFTGQVQLGATSGLPSGASATFNPTTTTGTSSTLTIATSSSTPAGTYTVTVSGLATNATVSPITLTLVVTPATSAGTVILAATPPTQTVTAGSSATYQISLTRSNFTGPVQLGATSLPSGANAAFSPNSTTGTSSTLTLTTSSSTPAGTYTLTLAGQATGISISPITVTLVVTAITTGTITLSASPLSQSIQVGQSTTFQVSINRTNTTSGVRLSASGLPNGANATFNPDTPTGTSATMTVTTGSSTPVGTYTLTINGQATNATVTPTTVTLVITASTPSSSVVIAVSPTVQTMRLGETKSFNITLQRTGTTAAVQFAAEGLPSGVTAVFNPNPATGGSVGMNLVVGSGAPIGVYVITIRGTANGVSQINAPTITLTIAL